MKRMHLTQIEKGFAAKRITYHADELCEGKTEFHFHFHAHVLDGPDEFVVAAEEVPDESLLVLGARA